MESERRPVPGMPGVEASADGRVWVNGKPKGYGSACRRGYHAMRIPNHGNKRVHRLVLLAFRGKPRPGREASHIDGDKSNNTIENLAWETHEQNMMREWGKPKPRKPKIPTPE